ncbi:hypothetical protein EV140_1735 [Microcella alkaliphila]|uniref:Uncharacterized protein n=1 Tax=Microcella alkaliphila TaxID=279828 RepID=A0A4V2FN20_9MICO|nr:DUF6421 family protein [Microcella alkaliphila]RZT59749.1 hypothetical protein EV140_1735 [Microcella alkaliphila]
MTDTAQRATSRAAGATVIGEPEVVEDARTEGPSAAEIIADPQWSALKAAAIAIRPHQIKDGSIPDVDAHGEAAENVAVIVDALRHFGPLIPYDSEYLLAAATDFERWRDGGFGVPDFYDALDAFTPAAERRDGVAHLVVFPMYTQNGSSDRLVEAVVFDVIWPDFVAELEATKYGNPLYLGLRFADFTPGYDTNSAVLFPESVAVTPRVPAGAPDGTAPQLPTFTWGAIFADREAARFRRVLRAAADITKLELPADAAQLLDDQALTERTFVMWDMIHDRAHMRGDLPFDPFMIKQRMPFFLYSLEELRCDLTAFRESVVLVRDEGTDDVTRQHAQLVQYAVIFDRIFRFAITGTRIRNYDAVGGQLLFAWMHQKGVLHWTDTQLAIDWEHVPDVVVALSDAVNDLYWRSIDRPKGAHWLAAYELVSSTLTPHPASQWAKGLPQEVLEGPLKGWTDLVMDDEFPLSMFYEALQKKMAGVIESTAGITGTSEV